MRIISILPLFPERRVRKHPVHIGVVVVRMLHIQACLGSCTAAANIDLASGSIGGVGSVFGKGTAAYSPVPLGIGEEIDTATDSSRTVFYMTTPIVKIDIIRKKTGICEKSKVPDIGGVILIPFQFTRVWEGLVPRKEAVDKAPIPMLLI